MPDDELEIDPKGLDALRTSDADVQILDVREDWEVTVCALAGSINRHSPYTIQIRGNRTTFPPPRELYPLCSHPMA